MPNFLIINIIFRFPSIPLIKHELNCQVLLLEMCSPCWTGQQFPRTKGIVINLIIHVSPAKILILNIIMHTNERPTPQQHKRYK